MTVAYVGLGANIGEPRRQLQAALEDLRHIPDSQLVANSSFYRSAPIGYVDQPDFLNAVAALETALEPEALLDSLQDIENRHGRTRSFQGAPRTLDLDLLLYGDRTLASPRLTLPHPRMHERAFVLKPLVELAPEAAIPGKGKARNLLQDCAGQTVERID
ncbi:MAG: 2-amino-4-hydroxy-6-hydroxymethyldihydropteridine diphosphokinase [Burkholderiales bacterium]